jgi:hypothetical protein
MLQPAVITRKDVCEGKEGAALAQKECKLSCLKCLDKFEVMKGAGKKRMSYFMLFLRIFADAVLINIDKT